MKKIITIILLLLSTVSTLTAQTSAHYTWSGDQCMGLLNFNNTTSTLDTSLLTFHWTLCPYGWPTSYVGFNPPTVFFPPGRWGVTLDVRDTSGTLLSTFTDSVTVWQIPYVSMVSPVNACKDDSVHSIAYTTVPGSVINWTDGDTIAYGTAIDTLHFSGLAGSHYYFVATSPTGCVAYGGAGTLASFYINSWSFHTYHDFMSGMSGAMDTMDICSSYVYDTMFKFGHTYNWTDTFPNIDSLYKYHWANGDTTSGTKVNHSGVYTCTVTSTYLGCSDSKSIYIRIDSVNHWNLASFTASPDTVCQWGISTLTYLTFTDFTEIPGSTYNWLHDTTVSIYDPDSGMIGYGGWPHYEAHFSDTGWHTIIHTFFNAWDSTLSMDSVRVYVAPFASFTSGFTYSVGLPCSDSITLSVTTSLPAKVMWSTPYGTDSGYTVVAHDTGLYAPYALETTYGCWSGVACCGSGIHVLPQVASYDTILLVTHGFEINHYHADYEDTVFINNIGTPCDTVITTDSAIIRIYTVDSTTVDYNDLQVRNHCTGFVISDSVYYTNYDTLATGVIIERDTLHSLSSDTIVNLATSTTGTITHTTSLDTATVGYSYPIVHDTTAFICGSARMTDSMVVTYKMVDSVHRTDSSRLVTRTCNGDTISFHIYTWYDTTHRYYNDTLHSFTRDTLNYAPDANAVMVLHHNADTVSLGNTVAYKYDTANFNCGITSTRDSMGIYLYRIDSVTTVDSYSVITNHCTGDTITVAGPFTSIFTLPHSFFNDTVHTVTTNTVYFPPDTSTSISESWWVDTLDGNISEYLETDTLRTDSNLIVTRYDTSVYGHTVDSVSHFEWDTLVTNHCTGDTISHQFRDSTSQFMIAEYFDTAITVTVDTIALQKEWTVKVYPNPFNNQITIESPGFIESVLYVVDGKKVGEYKGYRKVEIQTSNLAVGTYILSVFTDGRHIAEKMVKIE